MIRAVRNGTFVDGKQLQNNLHASWTQVCKRTISKERHRQRFQSRSARKTHLLKKTHLKSRMHFDRDNLRCDDDFSKHTL